MKKTIITAALCASFASTLVLPAVATAAPAAPAPTPAADGMGSKLAGKTVFLDPGHQGTNHSENLSRQVNDGRGGTKDCQTTGMTTMNGIPEHAINWNVAQLVKKSMESLGAKVVLSRQDDTGWGGCVDERAAAANASKADVAISIHADGAPAADHGFHFIIPALPIPDAKANQVQSTAGLAASKTVRDAYVKAGFSPANYANVQDGLQTRSDIAGPALTEVPDVFVEMGNGQNPDDAKLLETPDGQLKNAIAITTGLVGYLLGANPAAATTPARGTPPATTQPGTTPADSPSSPKTFTPDNSTSPTTTTSTPSEKSSTSAFTAPTTTATTPGATTTDPSSGTEKGGSEKDNGLVTTAVQLLRPVLAALGMTDISSMLSDSTVKSVSDLASSLLGMALQNGAVPPTTPAG